MEGYAVFFENNKKVYRLPVNPEEITEDPVMAIEKYEILKLGQIAVPSHMELTEYSFETEFPCKRGSYIPHYVETKNEFHGSDYYLSLFNKWRTKLVPVRFIASRTKEEVQDGVITEAEQIGRIINTLVLIEEMKITEKAGEEGDKYVSFKLLEYLEFGKKSVVKVTTDTSTATATGKRYKGAKEEANPKGNGYHIVQAGDSLWSIAKKYYGDGSKCNIIYNANKDKVKNPALIQTGWRLKIPSKDEFSKYNAPLPNTKVSEDTINKMVVAYSGKSSAFPFEQAVAGYGAQ